MKFSLLFIVALLQANFAHCFLQGPTVLPFPQKALALAKKGFASDSTAAVNNLDKPKKSDVPSSPIDLPSEQLEVSSTTTDMSSGQQALARMRRQQAEARNAELLKRSQVDEQDATPAQIPEVVANRMGQRMLPFVGLPLLGGMGTFVGFWYFSTYKDVELEPSAVAASTILWLVVSLGGITYSMLSASWDPERKGSALGFDEVQRNMNNIRTGLERSKENERLRDKYR